MRTVSGLSTASLRKVPPALGDMLLARAEWSYCAMEHSRIGAIELPEAGSPFHHLALPLERKPLRFTFTAGGRRQHGRSAPEMVPMVEAGTVGTSHWDGVLESACLYFTDDALAHALGIDGGKVEHTVRTRLDRRSPMLTGLLHALFSDASTGQRHGRLVGDAIFVALAAHLVPSQARHRRIETGEPWRVRNAVAFIHAHLTDPLSVAQIADAAATSPYYLNHAFSLALGCPIWRYVLAARARYAALLMRDPHVSLADVAQSAGFATYASFIAAIRREFGCTPATMRRATS